MWCLRQSRTTVIAHLLGRVWVSEGVDGVVDRCDDRGGVLSGGAAVGDDDGYVEVEEGGASVGTLDEGGDDRAVRGLPPDRVAAVFVEAAVVAPGAPRGVWRGFAVQSHGSTAQVGWTDRTPAQEWQNTGVRPARARASVRQSMQVVSAGNRPAPWQQRQWSPQVSQVSPRVLDEDVGACWRR
jgi:hypothetical protein